MKIYLATPYSHHDPAIERFRYLQINKVAEAIIKYHPKNYVYSPITHGHNFNLPGDWEYWMNHSTEFIWWSDMVLVYKGFGWQQSKGVTGERQAAKRFNKKVKFIKPLKGDHVMRSFHVRFWDWQSKNPDKSESEWPLWEHFNFDFNLGFIFACSLTSTCADCPIVWNKKRPCDDHLTEYGMWAKTKDPKYAEKIRDISWRY